MLFLAMKLRAAPGKESGWRLAAGMKDGSLGDLRLLSQRRSTSDRGRTDMRLEEHFESRSAMHTVQVSAADQAISLPRDLHQPKGADAALDAGKVRPRGTLPR